MVIYAGIWQMSDKPSDACLHSCLQRMAAEVLGAYCLTFSAKTTLFDVVLLKHFKLLLYNIYQVLMTFYRKQCILINPR